MIKRLLLIIVSLLTLAGCGNTNKNAFYLESKFYNKGEFVLVNSEEIKEYSKDSFVLYAYNNYCIFPTSCEDVFKTVMEKYHLDFLSMHFDEFKNTSYYEEVKYAPSIIIVKKGKIIAYLDADKDEDLNKYQNVEEFENWLKKYIYLRK